MSRGPMGHKNGTAQVERLLGGGDSRAANNAGKARRALPLRVQPRLPDHDREDVQSFFGPAIGETLCSARFGLG